MLSIKHLCLLLLFALGLETKATAEELLSRRVFTAIDVETTGLSPSKNRILEVSAIKFLGDTVLERRTWLVNPGTPIPPQSTRVHGITGEMIRKKPSFKEICPDLTKMISNTVVIAHNARFDWKFITSEYSRSGRMPPAVQVVDSVSLARFAFPGLDSYSLQELTKTLKLPAIPLHRAEADALTLVALTQKSISALGNKANASLLHEIQVAPKPKSSPAGNGLNQSAE